jgi:hypothetical protein
MFQLAGVLDISVDAVMLRKIRELERLMLNMWAKEREKSGTGKRGRVRSRPRR